MTPDETRRIGERIADRLFTNGQGKRAGRLVLTVDGPPKLDLGGWCRAAVIDQIVEELAMQEKP